MKVADDLDVATLLPARFASRDAELRAHLVAGRAEERAKGGLLLLLLLQDVAPALEHVPASQKVHVAADDEVAPRWPYLPAAHAEPEHELAPDK